MKILCTGDLHLGAHPEYGRQPGDRLRDQKRVLDQILTLAFNRHVDLILNTGDTFEGPGVPPEQLDVYARFIDAAAAIGLPVLAITGNGRHDAAMRDVNGMQIFAHVPGITVHSKPGLVDVAGVIVATLPWVHPGRLVAANGGGDRDEVNRDAAGLLVATARGLRAQTGGRQPAVLALHGSISGASLPTGIPTDELREPVLDLHDLQALGFDAIVASHIHVPQLTSDGVWEQAGDHEWAAVAPSVGVALYTGSPMPLNFGEANVAHGVWILEVDEHGVGATFTAIESPPFVTLDFHRDDAAAQLALSASIGWDVPDGAIVRVRYRATAEQQRHIDAPAIRAELLAAGAAVVKIQPDIVRADRARVEGVDETLAPLQALDLYLETNQVDGELADRMRARTALYLETVA